MKRRSGLWAVLVGGTLAGALDILFAVSFAGSHGVAPSRVLQSVASGLLGKAAFAGGAPSAAIGLACHFALSWLWATVFYVVAARIPRLVRRPLFSGMVFGVVVFLCMRLVVLPLSAFPAPVTFKPVATVLDLASHMFLFGFPIAWSAGKVIGRWPGESSEQDPLRETA